jgi:hypothetical protein
MLAIAFWFVQFYVQLVGVIQHMPQFSMPMDGDLKAALERVRASFGARSAAEAIRTLIHMADPKRPQDEPQEPNEKA